MTNQEKHLHLALGEIEELLTEYRIHAASGIPTDLQQSIRKVMRVADSVLERPVMLWGQQETIHG